MSQMPQNLEDAVVEVERIKGEVANFIEEKLPHMTTDSDSTEVITKVLQGLVLIADGAIDALLITDKAYRLVRGMVQDEGGEASS